MTEEGTCNLPLPIYEAVLCNLFRHGVLLHTVVCLTTRFHGAVEEDISDREYPHDVYTGRGTVAAPKGRSCCYRSGSGSPVVIVGEEGE